VSVYDPTMNNVLGKKLYTSTVIHISDNLELQFLGDCKSYYPLPYGPLKLTCENKK